MNYNKSFSDILGSHSYETRNNKKAVPDESVTVEIKKEVDDDTSQKQCDPSNNVKIPRYIPPLPNTDEVAKTVNSTGGSGLMDSYRYALLMHW